MCDGEDGYVARTGGNERSIVVAFSMRKADHLFVGMVRWFIGRRVGGVRIESVAARC